MSDVTSVVLVGVGGQGVLLASEITARAAILAGHDVKTNEVHGMAQRGGSVIAQVRWGESVASPLVERGTAKVLAGLEFVEPLRYADYPAPGAPVIVSRQRIIPTTVSTGQATYPEDTEERLKTVFDNLRLIDAVAEASKLGDPRGANVMIVGAMSVHLNLPDAAWTDAVARSVKARQVDLNLAAFAKGRELA